MTLTKVEYIDNQTVITAEQMNAMQDAIIENAANTVFLIYGTESKTFEEIMAAYVANKLVLLVERGRLYRLLERDINTILFLPITDAFSGSNNVSYVVTSDDVWTSGTTSVPFSTMEITENSDDTKLPTAKAVYDQIKLLSDEKISAPATAEIGQAIIVSGIDDNGVPTAWSVADIPDNDHINNLINSALGVIENGTY